MTLLLIMTIAIVFYDKRNAAFLNPTTWILIYSIFYVSLPSDLLDMAIMNLGFSFKKTYLSITNLFVFWWCLVIAGLSIFIKQKYYISVKTFKLTASETFSCIFLYFISSAAIFVIAIKYTQMASAGVNLYEEELSQYRLKIFAYIICTCTIALYLRFRKIWLLFPLCVIVYLGVISGKRTEIFIVTAAIISIVSLLRPHRSSIPLYCIVLFCLMVASLFVRLDYKISDIIENDIVLFAVLSEFFSTFITLPYVIENNIQISNPINYLLQFWNSIVYVWLGPFRGLILMDFKSVGSIMAADIGKGYGLAQFILSEMSYYFSWFGLFIAPFLVFFGFHWLFRIIFRFNSIFFKLVSLALMPVFIRLVFREGIANLSLYLYLCVLIASLFIAVAWVVRCHNH
jgi:hypothetical protein